MKKKNVISSIVMALVCFVSLGSPALGQAAELYHFEFSVDIGSDSELSDPQVDGNEGFDPGDVYLWQSAPVPAGGRDGHVQLRSG